MTPKQERFVAEYLIDLNATQAAIRAGYSKNGAEVQGHRLLSNVNVRAAINARREQLADKLEVTQERVLAEMAKIGFSDIRRLFDSNGALKRIEDLDDEAAACLSSVEVVTKKVPGSDSNEVEHTAKLKLWDKRAALVDIGKHLGMFVERHEHTGKDGGPIQTEDLSDMDALRRVRFLMNKAKREQPSIN